MENKYPIEKFLNHPREPTDEEIKECIEHENKTRSLASENSS